MQLSWKHWDNMVISKLKKSLLPCPKAMTEMQQHIPLQDKLGVSSTVIRSPALARISSTPACRCMEVKL